MGSMMLREELEYFIAHQEELVARFEGKVLAIRGKEVVGVFDSVLNAYLDAKRRYPPGSVMIQPCQRGADAYTVSVATRGLFAN